jgi:hypothetical protein
MLVTKNINPGLTPSSFGGDANFSASVPLHGTQTEIPLVFGNNVRPDKNGTDELQTSPFFNGITYMDLQDQDMPCKGVSHVYAGMSENYIVPVKQPTMGSSIGGVSAVPQPLPNMRGNAIGLAHTQLDIEGQGMKLLPSVNSFDITKKNTISDNFYNPLIIPKRLM